MHESPPRLCLLFELRIPQKEGGRHGAPRRGRTKNSDHPKKLVRCCNSIKSASADTTYDTREISRKRGAQQYRSYPINGTDNNANVAICFYRVSKRFLQ
jgi:hypothetical protein